MWRFAIALTSAVIGGALFGIGGAFFQGMVPNDATRWAFYFLIGIPVWIAAEIFGEALFMVIVPSAIRQWGNIARTAYLAFISCVTNASALITSAKITS
jgi:hypothetical protein